MTTRGQAFVAAGIVLAVAGVLLGYADVVRVGALLILAPVTARLLLRVRRSPLDLDRVVEPAHLVVDEPGEVVVTLHNRGRGTSAVQLAEERVDHPLGDRPRFVVPSMPAGQSRQVRYAVRSHRRGRFTLGPVRLVTTDPFGLTSSHADIVRLDHVVVLPRVVDLGTGRPPGVGFGNEGETPHLVSLHGEDDASVREYRDGDSLRRIHWPSTARTGELMVRQEDQPVRRRATIILDDRAEAFHDGSRSEPEPEARLGFGAFDEAFEYAVTAAASVTSHLAGLGYSVHLLTGDDVGAEDLPTTTTAATVPAALERLALLETTPGHTLDPLVHLGREVYTDGGVLIAILGDLTDPDLDRFAALRAPGTGALAIVVRRRAADPSLADGVAAVLRQGGWSVLVAPTGADLAQVWAGQSPGGTAYRPTAPAYGQSA